MPTTTRAREGALLLAAALFSGCGGPSVPGEPPRTSPLSRHAEPSPLPALGSSFADTTPPPDAPDAGPPAHHHHHHGGHGHAH